MAVDLNALDEHAQALWARVLTTAQAAGESVSEARLLSLVDAGAGKGVSIELVKARESEPMKIEDLKAALAALSPEERSSLLTTETPKVDGAETPAAKALAEQLKSRVPTQELQDWMVRQYRRRQSRPHPRVRRAWLHSGG